MRQSNADLYGQLAYEVYTMKSLVEDLTALIKSENKVIKGKIVDSHNKQVTYLHETIAKSLDGQKEEIATIAKSLTETPAATAATGVIARVTVGDAKPLGKSHGIEIDASDLAAAKLEVSDRIMKAMTNPDLTGEGSAALSRLDRIQTQAQFDNFLSTRNPALFAGQ
jgi:Tfp pilus assembly major pilin PilA